jgi:hypothetical protein
MPFIACGFADDNPQTIVGGGAGEFGMYGSIKCGGVDAALWMLGLKPGEKIVDLGAGLGV